MTSLSTVLVRRDKNEECTEYVYHTSGTVEGKFCFGIYRRSDKLSAHWFATNTTNNLLRYDRNIDIKTGDFLTKVHKDNEEAIEISRQKFIR